MNGRRILAGAGVLLAPVLYFALVFRFAANVPFLDDFDTVLAYVNLPVSDRLAMLFDLHNEHRIVLTRLFAELQLAVWNRVDFRIMVLAGNLMLLGVAGGFWILARRAALEPAFVGVPIGLVFLPQPWINMVWATSAVQMHGLLMFSLAALIFAASSRSDVFVGGLLCAAAATFSSGGGIFVFAPMMLVIACQSSETPISRKRRLIVTAVVMAVLGGLYAWGYRSPGGHGSVVDAWEHPWRALQYGLVFCGALLGSTRLSVIAGGGIVAWFVVLTRERYHRRNPEVYGFFAFLLAIAATAAVGRSNFGVEQALDPRYRIFSLLLTACVFHTLADPKRLKNSRASGVALGGLCVLIVVLYIEAYAGSYRQLVRHHTMLTTGFVENESRRRLLYPQDRLPHAEAILGTAISNGRYLPP